MITEENYIDFFKTDLEVTVTDIHFDLHDDRGKIHFKTSLGDTIRVEYSHLNEVNEHIMVKINDVYINELVLKKMDFDYPMKRLLNVHGLSNFYFEYYLKQKHSNGK